MFNSNFKIIFALSFVLLLNNVYCLDPNVPVDGVSSPMEEIFGEVPPTDKDFVYYFIVTFFIVSILSATVLNGAFIALTVLFWSQFKSLAFFWILTQLNFAVFVLAILNLIINVPASLFPKLMKEFAESVEFFTESFLAISYVIEFCQYGILFSNLVISCQRFAVFLLRKWGEILFKTPILQIWLIVIWVLSGIVVFIMTYNECLYRYSPMEQMYIMHCKSLKSLVNSPNPKIIAVVELIIQTIVPLLSFAFYVCIITKILLMKRAMLSKQEMGILKQAIAIFLLFQISSFIFIYCQTFRFKSATAFLLKRLVNTTQLLAGSATPCFFFFGSAEMRKLFRGKVSNKSSTNNVFSQSSSTGRRRTTGRSTQ